MAGIIHQRDAEIIALQEVVNEDVLSDIQQVTRALNTDYRHVWISEGSDNGIGQDVTVLSKFVALGEPVRRFPNERESYDTG